MKGEGARFVIDVPAYEPMTITAPLELVERT